MSVISYLIVIVKVDKSCEQVKRLIRQLLEPFKPELLTKTRVTHLHLPVNTRGKGSRTFIEVISYVFKLMAA